MADVVARRPARYAAAKRILFATVDSNWAGAQSQMLELAAGLDRAEFEPVVLTTGRGGLVERCRAAGLRTHLLPYRFLRRSFPFLGYYAAGPVAIRALLHREQIELVHTHCPNAAMPIMNAARGRQLPLVAHFHDLDQRWVTSRSLRVLNRARAVVVAISDAAERDATSRGVPPDRVRRIYNGVHLAPIATGARARLRRELGIGDDEIAIGLVGRLVRRKGAMDLIRALADERLRDRRVRAFLVGGAEREESRFPDELRRVASGVGVEHRVTLTGSREDAAQLPVAFDLVVMPSLREAFGRTAVEAMHAGTPLVVYREAALPELVRDGVEGIVIEPRDVKGLAAAIRRLADDEPLRTRLGSAGRVRASVFSHERFVAEVASLYRDLLATAQ